MLLHVSQPCRGDEKKEGRPTAAQIARPAKIPPRVLEIAQDLSGASFCTCKTHMGKTELLSAARAQRGTLWQRRLFVGKSRLQSCFVTRMLSVHKFTSSVPLERGFLWVHRRTLKIQSFPRLLTCTCLSIHTLLKYSDRRGWRRIECTKVVGVDREFIVTRNGAARPICAH